MRPPLSAQRAAWGNAGNSTPSACSATADMRGQRDIRQRAQRCGHFAAHHVPEPDPGKRPEGHLQRARPVDSAQERVGIQPTLHLAEGFVEVLAAPGQEKRLCQEREVLVTVQLPDRFVIAGS